MINILHKVQGTQVVTHLSGKDDSIRERRHGNPPEDPEDPDGSEYDSGG